jgi:uncharacterized coiled-coil DUF342 family protein
MKKTAKITKKTPFSPKKPFFSRELLILNDNLRTQVRNLSSERSNLLKKVAEMRKIGEKAVSPDQIYEKLKRGEPSFIDCLCRYVCDMPSFFEFSHENC